MKVPRARATRAPVRRARSPDTSRTVVSHHLSAVATTPGRRVTTPHAVRGHTCPAFNTRGNGLASILTLAHATGCNVAPMGLRDREVQAISTGLIQRIVESDEDPCRAMGLVAREGQGSWSFARLQGEDGKIRTGYVVIYFDGVAWVTAASLAKHPSSWGSDDMLIPADSIVGATVSLPRGASTPTSWTRVQILSPGQATCWVQTAEDTYQFTHLENPFAFEVAQELEGQLTGERERAGTSQASQATSISSSPPQPGRGAAGKASGTSGRQAGVTGRQRPAKSSGSTSQRRPGPSLIPLVRVAAMAVAAMLLLGTALVLPYDYYTVLRVVVCTFACVLLWLLGNPLAQPADSQLWSLIASGALVSTALLFNPVVPIALERETWAPIDIATAFGLLTVSFLLTREDGSLGRVRPPD